MTNALLPQHEHFTDPAKTDAVQSLVSTVVDAVEHCDTLLKPTHGESAERITRFSAMHSTHLTEIVDVMRSEGHVPDISGSWTGEAKDLKYKVKTAVGDDVDGDKAALCAIADRVLAAYDDTLADMEPTHPALSVLQRQQAEVRDARAHLTNGKDMA